MRGAEVHRSCVDFTGAIRMTDATTTPATLPATGFVRLPTILAVFPISESGWWAGIKAGKYPRGIKLGPRTTAWRTEDIRALIEQHSAAQPA